MICSYLVNSLPNNVVSPGFEQANPSLARLCMAGGLKDYKLLVRIKALESRAVSPMKPASVPP